MKLGLRGTWLGATILAFICVTSIRVSGQAPAQAEQMAESAFKNVTVLKGITVSEFMATMGVFSASLGMNCTDCHVDESSGSWARYADDNALKRTTRRMMLMVNTINKTNFGGRQVVTCTTCHRGDTRPRVMPSLDLLYSTPPPDEPGDPILQAPGQPPADQILDKYLQAVGGLQQLAALTSIVAQGNYLGFDDADRTAIEVFATAQGQRTTVVHTLSGDNTTVVTPTNAWVAAPAIDKPVPLFTLTGSDLEGMKLQAQVFFPARIKQALTNWRVGYPATIDDRDVTIVQGTMPGGGTATFCFDAQTGLLARLVYWGDSPVGRVVQRVDYSDYRDVAGVKLPFKWTATWLDGRSRFELTDAQANLAIPATRFARPAPSTPLRAQ